ncbi:MAG: type III secretion protein [Rhodomicrobium sp.]|nr:type III secretion protein [Rhodomicrobium sp.]
MKRRYLTTLHEAGTGLRRICYIFLSVIAMAVAAQAAEPKWPSGLYKYFIVDQDVKDVLTEFGRNINVPVKISDDVRGRRVKGSPPALDAKDFLENLCASYGLVWYYDGAVLHIATDGEIATDLIPLQFVKQDLALNRLREMGVLDPRFNVRSDPNSGVIFVSGPPDYRGKVKEAVVALENSLRPRAAREVKMDDEVQVKVFRGGS